MKWAASANVSKQKLSQSEIIGQRLFILGSCTRSQKCIGIQTNFCHPGPCQPQLIDANTLFPLSLDAKLTLPLPIKVDCWDENCVLFLPRTICSSLPIVRIHYNLRKEWMNKQWDERGQWKGSAKELESSRALWRKIYLASLLLPFFSACCLGEIWAL